MPRAKKDGKYINYYIDRKVYDLLQFYAEEQGYTTTMAIERILKQFFNTNKAIERMPQEELQA